MVAPSAPFDRTLALRGIGWLGERYRVEFDWDLFAGAGLFAGPDERRLAELDEAFAAPGVRAVIVARGGHGLMRIAHLAKLGAVLESPRWLVGFSDVTVLHNELCRLGVASLHAPNLTGLGRGDAQTRSRLVEVLEAPTRRRDHSGLECWSPGTARGPLAGGNLTLLFTCAAAGRLFLPPGCVLLIEDVGEWSYRLDRMLSALLVSGALAQVAAVVVGELTDCPAGKLQVAAEEVMRERLLTLNVPVLAGLRVGHGPYNEPVPLGLTAEVEGEEGGEGRLSIGTE